MPRPNTAQAGTCHGLAAALHGLTYTCFQLAVALIFAPWLEAAKSCLLQPVLSCLSAAFCRLP